MEHLFEELFWATAQNIANLDPLLDSNADKLTPEFAAAVRQISIEMRNAGQIEEAKIAMAIASSIYQRVDMPHEWAAVWFDYALMLYQEANTLEEYSAAQKMAANVEQGATHVQASDVAFKAMVLSADCCYFAYQLEKNTHTKGNLLRHTIGDLVKATKYSTEAVERTWLEQCVSLIAVTFKESKSLIAQTSQKTRISIVAISWNELHAETLLQELATNVEKFVPIDFESSEGLEKTIAEACELAGLSYNYGNAAAANARLDIAIERVEQLVKGKIGLEDWMFIIFQRYQGARDAGNDPAQLAKFRAFLRSRVELYRHMFRSRGGRLWAAQRLEYFLGEFLRDELKEGSIPTTELFHSIDMMKARMLLDQISGGSFQEFPTKELAEQAEQLEHQFLGFREEEALSDFIKEDKLHYSERLLESRLPIGMGDDYQARWAQLVAIENLHTEYNAGFQEIATVAELGDVMNALQPDEAMIEFCIPYHWSNSAYELEIFVITSKHVEAIHIPLNALPGWSDAFIVNFEGAQPLAFSALGNLVCYLRYIIQKRNFKVAQEGLEFFYLLLIAPLKEKGILPNNFSRWIIVPHGMLHYIPFAALSPGQGHYLIEDVALTVMPSSSVWLNTQKQQRPPVSSFLGLANPNFPYTHLPSLPDAEKELDRICKSLASLKCTPLKNDEASEEAFVMNAEGKSIIHLATHGEFPEHDVIDFHKFLLSPTEGYDGKLNADEVSSMKLHATRLVVLSICNGGLYRIGPGDEPYGLMSALLKANAENIIGTLWPLDDKMGRLFMIEFYKHLLQKGPADAMRQASIQFIQEGADLIDWAGFVLVGPGRPFQ